MRVSALWNNFCASADVAIVSIWIGEYDCQMPGLSTTNQLKQFYGNVWNISNEKWLVHDVVCVPSLVNNSLITLTLLFEIHLKFSLHVSAECTVQRSKTKMKFESKNPFINLIRCPCSSHCLTLPSHYTTAFRLDEWRRTITTITMRSAGHSIQSNRKIGTCRQCVPTISRIQYRINDLLVHQWKTNRSTNFWRE